MRNVALAVTYHDPKGQLVDQIRRILPDLAEIFGGIAVRASQNASAEGLGLFAAAGGRIEQETAADNEGVRKLGRARRATVALALGFELPFVMHCDADRALHWAEYHLAELQQVVAGLPPYDLTVLGRTPRAFDSHPRVQRDTEVIINQVYATVSGNNWDVGAAARGLSRAAAEAILAGCPDEAISTDVSWPLFIQRTGGFSQTYVETEGLEFETADRHSAEVAKAGGLAQWIAQIDNDPRQWANRLDFARIEVEGTFPYVEDNG